MNRQCLVETDASVSFVVCLAAGENRVLYDVLPKENGCCFYVRKRDFMPIKEILEKNGKKCVLKSDRSASGMKKRMISRVGAFIGVLIFLAAIYLYSRSVTNLKVTGNSLVSEEAISQAVYSCASLPIGKDDLDRVAIKNAVCFLDGISEASVEVRGNTLFISVLEELPNVEVPTGDVVSFYDALIEKVIVYEGECLVSEGQTIKSGEVLVRAVDGAANADIYGRVFFKKTICVPDVRMVRTRTGREETVYSLKENPRYTGKFSEYEKTVEKAIIKTAVPASVYLIRYYEIVESTEIVDFEKHKESIIKDGFSSLIAELPEDAEKVNRWFFVKTVDKIHILDLYYEATVKISGNR